jgi:RNHCP domain-containing protein
MDFYEAYTRPDHRGGRQRHKLNGRHGAVERARQFGDFTCRHCQRPVSTDPARSGVNNRNHCPHCLWSKHVDLHVSGDRLAACKGTMRPVGLTCKQVHKKYPGQPGELMLVHQCTDCGALSINRLAADDGAALVWEVFKDSLAATPDLEQAAWADGIELLAAEAGELVRLRLGESMMRET